MFVVSWSWYGGTGPSVACVAYMPSALLQLAGRSCPELGRAHPCLEPPSAASASHLLHARHLVAANVPSDSKCSRSGMLFLPSQRLAVAGACTSVAAHLTAGRASGVPGVRVDFCRTHLGAFCPVACPWGELTLPLLSCTSAPSACRRCGRSL